MEYIVFSVVGVALFTYLIAWIVFSRRVRAVEQAIIRTFLLKVAKVPAIIEVMRPHVADESAFDSLTKLHSTAMIRKYETIYILLEHNARIHQEFTFLMQLSMQIPALQKNEQFLYIRDFVMAYERNIKKDFSRYNQAVASWNRFVMIKNLTLVGLVLPGKKREFI